DHDLDGELAALAGRRAGGGVPLVVTGSVGRDLSAGLAAAILAATPARPWDVLDADDGPPDLDRLGATLRGGVTPGVIATAGSLRDLLDALTHGPGALPEDAARRLGVVLVVAPGPRGLRVDAAHYLRPTERDASGHLQRRPPAVLAARDPGTGALEHYAWGITAELGDAVDRSARDLEARQAERALLLARVAALPRTDRAVALAEAIAAEPAPEPAGHDRPGARPGARNPLTDPHRH
ncbi:MAG: hypothetical protein ACKOTZ_05175, partial [Chloroflexota bacterium]